MLFDSGDGHRRLLNTNALGVFGEALNQVLNGTWQGGGEENGLPSFGQGFQDKFDVFAEAHVEHDVGFIEDDHFDLVEA